MLELFNEIIRTALEPLTTTEAWYGIFFALAFRKQIIKLIDSAFAKGRGTIRERKSKSDNDD